MGEADEYYDQEAQRGNPQYQQGGGGGGYQQGGYQQNSYQQNGQYQNGDQFQQGSYGPPPPYSYNPPIQNETYSFNDAFKIEKPKAHDLWAGILVRSFSNSSHIASRS